MRFSRSVGRPDARSSAKSVTKPCETENGLRARNLARLKFPMMIHPTTLKILTCLFERYASSLRLREFAPLEVYTTL